MYTVGVVNRRQFKDGEDIIERGFREFLCMKSVRYVQSSGPILDNFGERRLRVR